MKDKTDIKWLNEQLKKLHDEVTILRQEKNEFRKQKELFSELELEHKRLFYQLPFPFAIYDSNGTLISVNRAFLEMCNIPSEELILNKFNILHDNSVSFFEYGEIKAAFTGESVFLPYFEINFKKFLKHYGIQREDTGIFTLTMFPVYDAIGKIRQVASIWKEITKEKSDAQMLRTFKSVLDVTANGIIITDAEGKIVWVNKAFISITGYEQDEALGKNPRLLKSGIHTEPFYKKLWDTILNGEVWQGEIVEKKKDGSLYSSLETITPVKNEKDEIQNFIAINTDISDRKKYENELEKLNRALKTISACNSVLIHSASENELLDKICKLIIETGGYYFAWIGLFDKSNLLKPVSFYGHEQGYFKNIVERLKSNQNVNFPMMKAVKEKVPFIIKDIKNDENFLTWKYEALKRGYASVIIIPLINEEKTLGVINIYSSSVDSFNNEELNLLKELSDDLSFGIKSLRIREERRSAALALSESEKRYRLFFEQDLAGAYISNPEGRILDCNTSFLKIFGFPSRIEAQNFNAADLHTDPDTRKVFLEKIKKDKMIQGLELEMKTFDGRIIYLIEDAWGTFNENNELFEINGYFQDITKRKLAEEALKEAKEKAEESDRLKTEFLAQMSHEIRTPVNVMLSYSSLLKEELNDSMPSEWNSAFKSIELAGRRLIRTIDLILNMSMIQTNKTGLNSSEVDIHFLLLNLVHEYQGIIEGKNLKIVLINNVENPVLLSDEFILTHIFQNLIDNAIKYTIEGKVEIIIYNDNKKNLCVDVRDTGIGISSQYLLRMFRPFTQEDTGYSRKYEGVGLGLSIVKKYLDLLGAAIRVESEKGKGSTFTIIF